MLVLTRRSGESVMVGDDVVVTVLEVRGDVIRLGIQAPRSIQVHREEVYRELRRANQDAASPAEEAIQALTTLLRRHPTVPSTPDHAGGPPAAVGHGARRGAERGRPRPSSRRPPDADPRPVPGPGVRPVPGGRARSVSDGGGQPVSDGDTDHSVDPDRGGQPVSDGDTDHSVDPDRGGQPD